MVLITGLGNPGDKYKNTRHNIGFQVIDEFARKNNFPDFHFAKKHNSEISESNLNNEKCILAKPQTFMNNSGKAIKSIINYGKGATSTSLPVDNLLGKLSRARNIAVIHDDIDLPIGKIRISVDRSAAGHKGVQSIIQELGTKNFVRFRVGIFPKIGKPKKPEDFVLQKFQQDEERIIKDTIKKTVEAIETMAKEGIEKAMNLYNQ